MNAMLAMQFEELYGVKMTDGIPLNFQENRVAIELYQNFKDSIHTIKPGDEYDAVAETARLLELSNYHKLVDDGESNTP